MKNVREFIWPVIGLLAVVISGWLLYRELRGMSLDDVWDSLTAVPAHRYALAALSTLVAYAALAWYDRIALLHLGVHHISWLFVSITSFTTYALSHNIGASVFSGAKSGVIGTASPLRTGATNDGGSPANFWNGDIYNALAINRALTPAEVLNLSNYWNAQ